MIKAEYISHMGNDLTVVNAARVSFGKAKTDLDDKDVKLINYLAKHKHFTPFEHCTLSIKISCPLYIRSQIMRHRTFSYNEISRRYTDKDLEFYIPVNFRKQHKTSKQCSDGNLNDKENLHAQMCFQYVIKKALDNYNALIKSGCSRELARGVLPQCTMTEFYMTGNLRNWAHFISLRQSKDAQYEVQIIANQILDITKQNFPIAYKALTETK